MDFRAEGGALRRHEDEVVESRAGVAMTRRLTFFGAVLLAGCAGAPMHECPHVYTLGDASAAVVVAEGRRVMKPGPLPAQDIPPGTPRAALEADGSYAGGRVFCSISDAKAALAEAHTKEIAGAGRPLRIYETAATWAGDVYELRPNDYRLKRSVPMVRVAD